jgi:DNA-binding transcriptional ArsR family regulator
MPLPATPRDRERLAESFRGLGHPTRLQILEALRGGDALSPSQLVLIVEPRVALGSVAHHTRELRAIGLIKPAGTGVVRGALQHFYRLSPRGRQMLEVVDRMVG